MNRKFIMILLAIVISSGCIAAQVPTFALTYDLYEGEEYIMNPNQKIVIIL